MMTRGAMVKVESALQKLNEIFTSHASIFHFLLIKARTVPIS